MSTRFEARFCRTPNDFELAARDWMRTWGFPDAEVTPNGPDAGIDVGAVGALAQVKAHMVPIGRPELQQLRGVAHRGETPIFFSLTAYTSEALAYAEEAGVLLFRFSGYDGSVESLNDGAAQLMAAGSAPSDERAVWRTFRGRLLVALIRMCEKPGSFLIVSESNAEWFVQAAERGSDGIAVQCCGDSLHPADRKAVARPRLLELGYHEPDLAPREPEPHLKSWGYVTYQEQNYYQWFPTGTPLAVLVDLAVRTLDDVLGVRDPGSLKIVVDR